MNVIVKKPSNLKSRSKTALIIAAFYLVYGLLLVFSNGNLFDWATGNVSFILNFFNLILIIPVVFFAAKEIANLCFVKHKGMLIFSVIALFALSFGTTLFLLLTRNNIVNWPHSLKSFYVYLIIALCSLVLVVVASLIATAIVSKKITFVSKKAKIWYPLLMLIIGLFFVAFLYTTIIHSWSTFIFILCISTFSDVFAYFTGSLIGKHKMCPKISPNKTWEGLIGSYTNTIILMCGIFGLFFIKQFGETSGALYSFLGCQTCQYGQGYNLQPYFWGIYIGVTILLITVNTLGDLSFSAIKRYFDIKDFSNLLPGHGGILDRLDALVFIFIFYFVVTIILQVATNSPGISYLWPNI